MIEDHPHPWRAQPSESRRAGTWVVLDARGSLVADRMGEDVARLLVRAAAEERRRDDDPIAANLFVVEEPRGLQLLSAVRS